jgi:hypothetical protein
MSGGQVVKDVQEAFRLAGYRTAYRILNATPRNMTGRLLSNARM